MTCEAIVEVGIVRRPQFQHRAVFAYLAFKKKMHLGLHRPQEFGIDWNNILDSGPLLGDEVKVSIEIEANRAGERTAK